MTNLAQEFLKSILHYEPETGAFIRLSVRNPRHRLGETAGRIDAKGYIIIEINGKSYRAHRLAWFYMTGKWPEDEIDHKDLNKSNNAWLNIREATNQQNKYNRSPTIKNKLGIKGVHLKGNK